MRSGGRTAVMTTTRPARAAATASSEKRAPEVGTPEVETESVLLRELADALHQVRQGRFDVRLPRRHGFAGEVVDQFNELAVLQERRNRDLLRISRVVGREGRMSDRL